MTFRDIHTHPDVTLAGEESLGYTRGVQAGSGDVQDGHEEQPAHLTHGGGPQEALCDHKVQRGNNSTETQTHKHTWDTQDRAGINLTIYIALLDTSSNALLLEVITICWITLYFFALMKHTNSQN